MRSSICTVLISVQQQRQSSMGLLQSLCTSGGLAGASSLRNHQHLFWRRQKAEGTGQRRRRASRVDIQHVALANAAIRSVAREQHLGLADWQSMLHLGWPREMVLADDLHPRRTSNTFIGNIYLHALAVL